MVSIIADEAGDWSPLCALLSSVPWEVFWPGW